MNRFNKLTNRLTLIAALLLGLALTSCDKEPKPTPQTGSERILFSVACQSASARSLSTAEIISTSCPTIWEWARLSSSITP